MLMWQGFRATCNVKIMDKHRAWQLFYQLRHKSRISIQLITCHHALRLSPCSNRPIQCPIQPILFLTFRATLQTLLDKTFYLLGNNKGL